jgi:UTP--glucose-1-phosphate uridylyltransferase
VRSDAYVLTDDYHVAPHPDRRDAPLVVELDDNYKFVNQLDAAFPAGPPSLIACTRFEVEGEFVFGADVAAQGEVRLINESDEPVTIEEGTELSGEYRY